MVHDRAVMEQQVLAGVLGAAVGDAMGVPVEFCSREELRRNPVTGYRRDGTYHMPAGTWSDDTSMVLATMDSMSRGLDYDDMMRRFVLWQNRADYTATGVTFDIGIATRKALHRFENGSVAMTCGGSGEYDNGNGSLMRILPAVIYAFYGDNLSQEEQMTIIHNTSSLTHSNPRSLVGCGIYAHVLQEILSGGKDIRGAIAKAFEYYNQKPAFAKELKYYKRLNEDNFAALPEDDIPSSGYVVNTLEAALWCLMNTASYEECVLKAVNLGDDTDTVAAVAGGLAGCLYGKESIPAAWEKGLLNVELLNSYCDAFAASLGKAITHDVTTGRKKPAEHKIVDMHCHVVPGVDDGAANLPMALEMLRMEVAQGVKHVACTSHNWTN
ncbi:MAG: ADP-ribosylglycohydrolase family protein, partial [Clostridia bacterium]|nr:ADP-ribosylglycohydrolase family protein [Clostridia bacterium]